MQIVAIFLKSLSKAIAFCGIVLAFVSCATERSVTYSKGAVRGLDKYKEGYSYVKDGNGMMRVKSDRRSQYEGQSKYLGGDAYGSKEYRSTKYNAKQWQKKSNVTKAYMGNTDASRFQTPSRESTKKSRFAESESSLANQQFGTNRVSKTKADQRYDREISTNESYRVQRRRESRPDPVIMSREERRSLSVSESKSLLGR